MFRIELMKAAACYSLTDVVIEELPLPSLESGDLLVRVEVCGLCGSDISKLTAEYNSVRKILGHEITGIVEACDAEVRKFEVGQRVVAAHHVPCFTCHYCRRGSNTMCATFKQSNLDPGGFAELVRVPAANVEHVTYELPEEMSFDVGSFVEPLACCLRAMRRTPLQDGDVALVLGLGSIGLLFLQLFKVLHLHNVGADLVPERRALGRTYGAELVGSPADDDFLEALRHLSEGRGPDLVVTATESPQALQQALTLVRDGGTVNLFGGIATPVVGIDIAGMYKREITLLASYSSAPMDFPFALELLHTEQVRVTEMVTHRYGLDGLGQAIDGMLKKVGIKNVILPNA
jgi:L-iditol 2-dehydrogenase